MYHMGTWTRGSKLAPVLASGGASISEPEA